jgi:tRNA threonylcarbamoyladenosine biosynthesis protein TsaE
MRLTLLSASPEDTRFVARALGDALRPGDVVALSGDLGAGKTLFCKGVGESLGIPPDRIVSPSFTIMTEHHGREPLVHVDAYRLADAREAAAAGLSDVLGGEGICLVEWAEKIDPLLPKDCIRVKFVILNGDKRWVHAIVPDEPRFSGFAARCRRFLPGGEA